MSDVPALALTGVTRVYSQGEQELQIFKGLDLAVKHGEIVAMVGQSGSGKSSLLHIAGLLERPTSGAVYIDGRDCTQLTDRARTRVRRHEIGFIYQSHHLLPEFNALENVVVPQMIAGATLNDAEIRGKDLLGRLGLTSRLEHRPAELSGGEQQRVAIARALANRPGLLLADEPTGNLDPRTAERVHAEFMHLVAEEGLATLVATHNLDLAHKMHRVVHLEDGHLSE
ncbi:MAG: ABC transporter ATP-binding protein [Hyphomicrobiales bacterium]|nr:ABC transporter ATP-binding protein [Hyphomicrobiales bacterium]